MPRVYRMANGQISVRQQVLNFVRANPACTARDVQAALNLIPDTANMTLSRLRRDGLIDASKAVNSKMWLWFGAEQEEPDDSVDRAPPKRIMTSEWTGHKRDDLLTAFFGAAA